MPATADAPGARLRADLELVEPVGNEIFLNLRCGSDALVARVPPQDLAPSGTTIELAFDPARLHLFDAASGRRLGP